MTISETNIRQLIDPHFLTPKEAETRAAQMYAMYADEQDPKTLLEVGAAFGGLTRERVRQIFTLYGYPRRTTRESKRIKKARP